MKRVILYILIGIVCINSFALTELYKFPMLAIHYQEHNQLDPSVDFIDFLAMHYWGTDLNDQDDDRDDALPFKKYQHEGISIPMTIHPTIILTLNSEPNYNTLFSAYRTPHFENAPMGSLFKPPRIS